MDKEDDWYLIRSAAEEEWQEAMGVVWRTFQAFEGKEYPEEGVRNFNDFITGSDLFHMFQKGVYQMFVAVDQTQSKIIGVITLRNIHHISLLFVDKKYHRQGIGKALIDYVHNYLLTELGEEFMTVNAAMRLVFIISLVSAMRHQNRWRMALSIHR